MLLRICRILIAVFIAATLAFFTDWPARLVHHSSATVVAASHAANDSPQFHTLQGQEAIEHLKQQDAYDSLAEAIDSIKYEARQQGSPKIEALGEAYELPNEAQDLVAYIKPDGIHVTSLGSEKADWQLGLTLKDYGYGKRMVPIYPGLVEASANRVEVARQSAIVEWFVNSARGIEHGLNITAAPSQEKADGPLRLRFEVTGDLQATVNGDGRGASFTSAGGNIVMGYSKLLTQDASGRALWSRMKLEGSDLVIEVEDSGAEYPLVIDPLLTQQQKLVASDGSFVTNFGWSIAISNDTVVVGAIGWHLYQGAAYVFVRSGNTWLQQQVLVASDGAANTLFGNSVAINGDTIVVGASQGNAAYVFVRSGATWSQLQKLVASDGAPREQFGFSVAISGETMVVGAKYAGVGAAYVFVRSGTTWSEQQKLVATDSAGGDQFGYSVGISGETIVIGKSAKSAYVFVRSGTTWSEQQKLVPTDVEANILFGDSVAISGKTIVVGGRINHTAYVFVRSGTTWSQQQKLKVSDSPDSFAGGLSVAIIGETIVVGASDNDLGAGAAFTFVRSGTTWSQQQKLVATDGAEDDKFGYSVAISADTVVVGAVADTIGVRKSQGSAYVFGQGGTEQARVIASDGAASDAFGRGVAISGDTVVVGADGDDIGANTDQGSAYVFVRSGATWSQQQKLVATDGVTRDNFGFSVAISGETIVVGAYQDKGAAYVFIRSGIIWSQQQKLVPTDGAAGDNFGYSVAISGDTIVVGALGIEVGADVPRGSAYVFVRSGTKWTQQAKLTAFNGDGVAGIGNSVSINGDTLVIGHPYDYFGGNASQGSAYVFVRSGTVWTQQARLTASDGAAGDDFGYSVAISGETIVVGALLDTVRTTTGQGSAYVFVRSGTVWSEQQKLVASDGTANNGFGNSVAISGSSIVVGAPFKAIGANENQGSAYII
jgi:hypothetical protein